MSLNRHFWEGVQNRFKSHPGERKAESHSTLQSFYVVFDAALRILYVILCHTGEEETSDCDRNHQRSLKERVWGDRLHVLECCLYLHSGGRLTLVLPSNPDMVPPLGCASTPFCWRKSISASQAYLPRLIVLIRIWLRDSDDTEEIMIGDAERETFVCMELQGRNGLNGWPKKRDKRDIKSSALGFCRHCGHMVFVEPNWIMLCSLGIMYSSGRSCSSTWKTWS